MDNSVPPPDAINQTQALQQTLGNNDGLVNAHGENLQCQWRGCGERCVSPEALYEHVCERHVGRKSTNNLNLTCAWGQCNTTTVKRDHITSHIRVHVPLKPHKCDFCGKAFKRPQDLKKHVKTHADDSVLPRSPDPLGGPRQGPGMMAPGQGSYYQPAMGPPDYAQQHHAAQYYQPQHPQQGGQHPAYAPMYYAGAPQQASYDYEMRKRGIDALDQFFGDLKRRQLDPSNYQLISRRLFELQGLQLPMITQQPMSAMPAYQPISAVGGGYDHPDPIQAYSLPPMGNAKTREDLTSIDQILDQMQAALYEHDTHMSQPSMPSSMSYNAYSNNQNLPSATLPSTHAHSNLNVHQHQGSVASSNDATTPGLTPPSSAQSPMTATSVHSNNAMYPLLPAGSTEQMAYAATNATMSGMYETEDQRRRYGGGMLQRAKPGKDAAEASRDGSATPPAATLNKQTKNKKKSSTKSSNIDPALSGDAQTPGSSKSSGSTSQAAEQENEWFAQMRLIEWMRAMIKKTLERDFGGSQGEAGSKPQDTDMTDVDDDHKKDQEQLYPVLQAVSAQGA